MKHALTFKEHLFLTEARDPDVKYSEKQVKGALDRVTAALSGSASGAMTKLAKRYARLEASMAAMKEKHAELNARLKEDVAGLFDAEDVVLTRVVETAQFTLTMAKEIPKKEGGKEVDYEKIAAALAELVAPELQAKVDEITAQYTKTLDPKPPVKKLTVSKEVVKEGLLDDLGRLRDWAARLLKSVSSWASRYDDRLDALRRKAGL
jgi:primosomal protein N''